MAFLFLHLPWQINTVKPLTKGEKSPFIWNYLGAAKEQPGNPADIAGQPHIHRPHDIKGLSLVLKARL